MCITYSYMDIEKVIADCPFRVASSWIFWSSSVLRWGARKQSTQFNNHRSCLKQARAAFLSVYFPCIALHLLFNFMAKWTSLTSCSPPRSSRPALTPTSPSPLFSSPTRGPPRSLITDTAKRSRPPKGRAALAELWQMRLNSLSLMNTHNEWKHTLNTPCIVHINMYTNYSSSHFFSSSVSGWSRQCQQTLTRSREREAHPVGCDDAR